MSNWSTAPTTPAVWHGRRHIDLCRAEMVLLATVAASPRQAWPLLQAAGVHILSFADLDLCAIAGVLEIAAQPIGAPWTAANVFNSIRRILLGLSLWDDADKRSFVTTGSIWGPGPLAALLHREEFERSVLKARIDVVCRLRASMQLEAAA